VLCNLIVPIIRPSKQIHSLSVSLSWRLCTPLAAHRYTQVFKVVDFSYHFDLCITMGAGGGVIFFINTPENMIMSHLRLKRVSTRNLNSEAPPNRWRFLVNWLFASLMLGVPVVSTARANPLKSPSSIWRRVVLVAFLVGMMVTGHVALADLNEGLVAYYPFEGNAKDESGNGNDGTVNGEIEYVKGIVGQAAKFNGTNNYVKIVNPVQKFDTQYTITGWVYTEGRGGSLISKYTWRAPGGGRGFTLFPTTESGNGVGHVGSTFFAIAMFNEGWNPSKYPKYTMPIGEFQYITAVYDGGNIKIYINGIVEAEKIISHSDTLDNPYDLLIGTYWDNNGTKIVAENTNRTFDGLIDDLRIYNRALSKNEIQALYQQRTTCQLYAVHDAGLNNTQFFTVSPETFEVKALGDMKKAHDIEALDIHPQTAELFAASGKDTKTKGHLYQLNGQTGELISIGSTGFKEIDGLSFHPDGTLWGWATGDGLVTIDTTTGQANLVAAYPGEIEDLTWNTAGTILFGVANLRNNPDAGVKLLAYDGNTVATVCEELTQSLEIEALDTLPDDTLIFGIHNKTSLPLGVVDVTNCQITAETEIATNYNDVEGIAWPTKACASQEVARSCQEIKENAPSSEDGIYQIDPDGSGGNQPFEVYCDMTTSDGGFTFAIGNVVINSFDSIKGGCPKGLSPFQLNSDSHGIALHNYVANQLEGNTQYWANVFAGPHKHTNHPRHNDNEYGYLDSKGEWQNADIDESQSPYYDISSNWNLNIFDPIPLVGETGYYADGKKVLYNSTERVIEGYAICSTNDK